MGLEIEDLSYENVLPGVKSILKNAVTGFIEEDWQYGQLYDWAAGLPPYDSNHSGEVQETK